MQGSSISNDSTSSQSTQWEQNLSKITNIYLNENMKSIIPPLFLLLENSNNKVHKYLTSKGIEQQFFFAYYLSLYMASRSALCYAIKKLNNFDLFSRDDILNFMLCSRERISGEDLAWVREAEPTKQIFRGNICKKPAEQTLEMKSVSELKKKDQELYDAIRFIQVIYKQFAIDYICRLDVDQRFLNILEGDLIKGGYGWIVKQYRKDLQIYQKGEIRGIEASNRTIKFPKIHKSYQKNRNNKKQQ